MSQKISKKQRKQSRSKNEQKKVFIYMRYSSSMQNALSIDAQRRAIKKFCKEKGYVIVEEYVDEAKSATTDDRPEFQKMIKDCKNSDVCAIIVHKLDRFSRNINDAYIYKAILEKLGINLVSVTEPLNNTPVDNLFKGIMFSVNEYFSENLGTEVEKGKKEIAHKNMHTGGVPPYGYDIGEDRTYVINPKEAKAVKMIFNMFITGYSYQQIADRLNKAGYRTKKGLKFNKNSFSSILANAEKYSGTYIYNRALAKYSDGTRNSHRYKDESEIIKNEGGMPQIISENTYNSVIEKLENNQNQYGLHYSKRYYLLNGLVKCGDCGRSFSGNTSLCGRNKTEYATYRCGNYRGECNNKAVNTDYLNEFVVSILQDIIFSEKNYDTMIKAFNHKIDSKKSENQNRIISLQNELVDKERAIVNITEAISKNYNDELIKKLDELTADKEALHKKVTHYKNYNYDEYTKDDIIRAKKKFKTYLVKKDTVACRKLMHTFIDEIVVYKDRVEVTIKTDKTA